MEGAEGNDAAEPAPSQDLNEETPQSDCPQIEVVASRLQPLLRPLSDGLSNQEIAEKLSLAVHTVENYVSELLLEFDCSTRVRLAIQAKRWIKLQESKERAP